MVNRSHDYVNPFMHTPQLIYCNFSEGRGEVPEFEVFAGAKHPRTPQIRENFDSIRKLHGNARLLEIRDEFHLPIVQIDL